MLDIRLIRENPDLVRAGIAKKNDKTDIDRILELDEKRREIIREVEQLKSERNKVSAEVAKMKKAGENADDEIRSMKAVGERISQLDEQQRQIEEEMQGLLIWVPNLPHESVPVGGEEDMVLVRSWGKVPEPKFEVKPHWELGEELGILDMAGAARISGSGFYLLKGLGARLQRALVAYMLDTHTSDGFLEIAAPFIVTSDT